MYRRRLEKKIKGLKKNASQKQLRIKSKATRNIKLARRLERNTILE